jgi:hypothetical protein
MSAGQARSVRSQIALVEVEDLEAAGLVPPDLEDLLAVDADPKSRELVGTSVPPEMCSQVDFNALLDHFASCFSSPSIGMFASMSAHRTCAYAIRPIAFARSSLASRSARRIDLSKNSGLTQVRYSPKNAPTGPDRYLFLREQELGPAKPSTFPAHRECLANEQLTQSVPQWFSIVDHRLEIMPEGVADEVHCRWKAALVKRRDTAAVNLNCVYRHEWLQWQ